MRLKKDKKKIPIFNFVFWVCLLCVLLLFVLKQLVSKYQDRLVNHSFCEGGGFGKEET